MIDCNAKFPFQNMMNVQVWTMAVNTTASTNWAAMSVSAGLAMNFAPMGSSVKVS